MKLPSKKSLSYRILQIIYQQGPLGVSECIPRFPDTTLMVLRTTFGKMREEGLIVEVGGKHTLTADTRRTFADLYGPTGQVAAKREYSPFGKPLNPSLIPSALGTREGSNDFRSWQSRF